MSGPDGQGGFNFPDFLPELFNLANDRDAAEHESLEFLSREVSGLFANAGQLDAEVVVFKPAIRGALTDAGLPGDLSHGRGGGDDGQSGLLAKGEAGFLDFPPIFSHFLPLRVSGVDSRLRGNDGTGAGMTGLGRE